LRDFQKRARGYLTQPGPATNWTASGGKRAVVSSIPTGPSNVVARILCFTGAGARVFFYTGGGTALFNSKYGARGQTTTTSLVVDFSDAILLAGTNVDNLYQARRARRLRRSAGLTRSASFCGARRNKMNNWMNLGFDGGFHRPFAAALSVGWTPDAVFAPGGGDEQSLSSGARLYDRGQRHDAERGLMTQSGVQDARRRAAHSSNTTTSCAPAARVTHALARHAAPSNSTARAAPSTPPRLQLTAAQLTTSYVEYTAQLTAPLTTIPSDLLLRVYADGTPNQKRPVLRRLHRDFSHGAAGERFAGARQPRRGS